MDPLISSSLWTTVETLSLGAQRARALRDASLVELAELVGALAAELATRGVQAAIPLGLVQARLEAITSTVDMVAACGRHQKGDAGPTGWAHPPEAPDSPVEARPSDEGVEGWIPLGPIAIEEPTS